MSSPSSLTLSATQGPTRRRSDHVGKVIELCENGRGAKIAQVAVTQPGGGVKIYTPYVVWLQRA